MDKKKELQRQRAREEDAVLMKVVYWIVGAVVLEGVLLFFNSHYAQLTAEGVRALLRLQVGMIVLVAVGAAAGIVCAALAVRRRKEGTKSAGLLSVLAVFLLMLAVCSLVSRLGGRAGIRFLCVVVPVVAALALVYYLYQREFFLICCMGALGILGVWLPSHWIGRTPLVYVYAVIVAVILVGVLVFSRRLQTKKGVLILRGKRREVFPHNANYAVLYITCGVVAAVLVAALLLGSMVLLYGILAAWLLIMAVYYTIRLM